MSQSFVIEVVMPEVPADKDIINLTGGLKWLIESSAAGRNVLPKGTVVRHLCTLEPGESWEVVVPVAEGEEVEEDAALLRGGRLRRAKKEIRHLLGPLAEGSRVADVRLCGDTNTLNANVQLASCPVAIPFVFELLPETVGRVLG